MEARIARLFESHEHHDLHACDRIHAGRWRKLDTMDGAANKRFAERSPQRPAFPFGKWSL